MYGFLLGNRQLITGCLILRADQSLKHRFIADRESRALQYCDLTLTEVGQYASDRLTRGTNNLRDLFMRESQFDLWFSLLWAG